MRNRALKLATKLLLIWGGLSLIAGLCVVAFLAYKMGLGNHDEIDSASTHDVRFVLNWCGLGESRAERVLHSHVSARSFTGDHLDAYAIKISEVEISELESQSKNFGGRWYRGDQLPQILSNVVTFVGAWHHEVTWFPTEAELRTSEIYVYPWSIYLHGITPAAAELIFIRPSDKMVFYFGGKT